MADGPIDLSILLFDDVEVLDFAGPYEVFTNAEHADGRRAFHVATIAPSREGIRARHGLTVIPDRDLAAPERARVLLVPGGPGVRPLLDDPDVVAYVTGAAASARLVLSVCTGALLLARAGLLDDREVTTHHQAIEELTRLAPRATVRRDQRWVDAGSVATSAGVTAGLDLSLHVVARLVGPDAAARVATRIEYPMNVGH